MAQEEVLAPILIRIKNEIGHDACWPAGQCRRNCDHCVAKKVSVGRVARPARVYVYIPCRICLLVFFLTYYYILSFLVFRVLFCFYITKQTNVKQILEINVIKIILL